jgi:hypothetical protein
MSKFDEIVLRVEDHTSSRLQQPHHQRGQQPRPSKADEEWRAALRRVLLPDADQLRVLDALGDLLGGPLWREQERERQALRRLQAVEAIGRARTSSAG